MKDIPRKSRTRSVLRRNDVNGVLRSTLGVGGCVGKVPRLFGKHLSSDLGHFREGNVTDGV
jgi:hypothetical protein